MPNQKIRLELDYIPSKHDSNKGYLCFVVVANKQNHNVNLKPVEIHKLYIPISNSMTDPQPAPNPSTATSPNDTPSTSLKTKLNKDSVRWLQQLAVITLKNLESHNFNAEFLACKMNLSLRQMHRRLKQLTGLNPSQYLREVRLQQARVLLENQTYPVIKMVCYKVGMRDVKYFSRQFKKRFGQSPSVYLN